MNASRVLVLGGRGFIGRHVVQAMRAQGQIVTVGSRFAQAETSRLPLHELRTTDDYLAALRGYDVVVNCVGILRERLHETYESIHTLAPARLARATAQLGIRFIHVSALGLSETARSRFIRSKWAGEQAVREANPRAVVVRPSLLDGEGGFGAKWVRRVANWPIHAVPANAVGDIAALQVTDLGEAIANLAACRPEDLPTEVELGGRVRAPMMGWLSAHRATQSEPWRIYVPNWLARAAAHLCDLLHVTPYSWGHLELMGRANVPRSDDLASWLGRAPAPVGHLRLIKLAQTQPRRPLQSAHPTPAQSARPRG